MHLPRHIARIVARALVGLAMLTTCLLGHPAVASADPIAEALNQLQEASTELAAINAQRDELELNYRTRVARIEQLKDTQGGFVSDLELRAQLRQAREVAEELNGLAGTWRDARSRQDLARRVLVSAYDEEIARLETSLFSATPATQQAVILQLQALQQDREAQRRAISQDPLAEIDVPDLRGFVSDDPDEVFAAIAELDDNHEKLAAQLGEVDERIAAIERQRRLASFAEDTRDETNLFGEEARSIKVATSATGSQTGAASGSTRPNQFGSAEGKTSTGNIAPPAGEANGGGQVPASDGEADPSASPAPSDDAMGAYNGGTDRNNDADSGGAAPGGMPGYAIEPPPVDPGAPSVPTTNSAGDPSLIRSDADLLHVTATGAAGTPARSLDGELQSLRKRRSDLKKSLGSLEQQRNQLQQQVDGLLQ